jgi:hypothetical protein
MKSLARLIQLFAGAAMLRVQNKPLMKGDASLDNAFRGIFEAFTVNENPYAPALHRRR